MVSEPAPARFGVLICEDAWFDEPAHAALVERSYGITVLLATHLGRAIRFQVTDDTLRVFASRDSSGVRGAGKGPLRHRVEHAQRHVEGQRFHHLYNPRVVHQRDGHAGGQQRDGEEQPLVAPAHARHRTDVAGRTVGHAQVAKRFRRPTMQYRSRDGKLGNFVAIAPDTYQRVGVDREH